MQHRPPNNSRKSGNSDKFVPDDSGLVNGNKPSGSADNNNNIYLKSNIQKSSIDYKIDRILL